MRREANPTSSRPERIAPASVAVKTGWLDRVLTAMGPGTTFRAVAEGAALPRSLVGTENKLVLDGLRG